MLMVVATLLHPVVRPPQRSLPASRAGRGSCGLHACLLLVLLGLPGLYAGQRRGVGRLGLVGLLTAFSGTYLIAVTGNFGSSLRSWLSSHPRCWTPLASTCRC